MLRLHPAQTADEAHVSGEWKFDTPVEREWQRHVLEVISRRLGPAGWGRALEVGCSEGVFTEQLAARCASVDAVDISPTAVARASSRCGGHANVHVSCRDVATEDIPGGYDIVFVMDILWLVVGSRRQADIIRRLTGALRPGGLLVFSDSRMPRGVRHPLWSTFLPSGADVWAHRIRSAPGLTVVHTEAYPPPGKAAPGFWDKLFVIYRNDRSEVRSVRPSHPPQSGARNKPAVRL